MATAGGVCKADRGGRQLGAVAEGNNGGRATENRDLSVISHPRTLFAFDTTLFVFLLLAFSFESLSALH